MWYLEITNLYQNTNLLVKIGLTALARMLNGSEICLNMTNYSCTCMVACGWQPLQLLIAFVPSDSNILPKKWLHFELRSIMSTFSICKISYIDWINLFMLVCFSKLLSELCQCCNITTQWTKMLYSHSKYELSANGHAPMQCVSTLWFVWLSGLS